MIANAGNVIDIDGNVYQSVRIGNQVWMTENLRVTKYNDGSAIPKITDDAAWADIYTNGLTTPAYCFYNNTANTDSITKFGALYNGYAVNTGKLAPAGWHVSSDTEWTILTNYLGGENIAGGKLKEAGLWNTPNTGATNETGFSALPGGFRIDNTGTFYGIGFNGYWWSPATGGAVSSWTRGMYCYYALVYPCDYSYTTGLSVRCVRD